MNFLREVKNILGRRLTEQERFLRLCAKGSVKKIEEALNLGADINEPALMQKIRITPLSAAAMYENKRAMEFLIENGADYISLLFSAVIYDKRELAELIINCGGDLNARDSQDHTALLCAVNENKIEPLKWLIELGADVNEKMSAGYNALTYAALMFMNKEFEIDPEIIKILVKEGADYSDAMLLAVREKNLRLIIILLKNGANINRKNSFGQSPLYLAMFDLKENSDVLMIKFLVKCRADVNEIFTFDDGAVTTPLNLAVSMNRPDVAKILLDYGANPNFQDNKGRTSLVYSVLTGNEILRVILSHGGNPNIKDIEGRTALMLAVIDGGSEDGIIESLIEFGADPNIQDNKGMTALMWAIAGKDRSSDFVMSALIRTGAFRAKGWGAWLALAVLYATSRREAQLNIIKFLIDNGADINIEDKKGMNAFSYAMLDLDDDVAEILKEAEAKNSKV